MKKWMTTIPASLSNSDQNTDDFYHKHSSFSPYVKVNEYTTMEKSRPPAKLPDEDAMYDNLEHYEPSPATSNDSQTGYVASSSSVLSGEDSFYDDPFSENGMFSGPVTDLDEDSDPEEIKMYNPATKTISIKKPRGKHNVEIQVNVQLRNLEQDIQRMIDEMASIEGSVSSVSSKGDSGIQEDVPRIEEDTGERRSPSQAAYGSKNRQIFWIGNKKWNINRLKEDKDVRNVTCLVNENFDENKVFKSSVTGVSLGMSGTTLGPPKQAPDWRSGVQRYQKRSPVVVSRRKYQGRRAFCWMAALALAVALASMAFYAVADVQSTLRTQFNMGMAALMTVQASKLVSAMFVPAVVPLFIGRKWTCFSGALLSLAWPASQLLPLQRAEMFGAEAVAAAAQGLAEALLLGAALPMAGEVADPRGPNAIAAALAALASARALGHAAGALLDAAVLNQGVGSWLPDDVSSNCLKNQCSSLPVNNSRFLWDRLNTYLWPPLLAVPVISALIIAIAVHPPSNAGRKLDLSGPKKSHGVVKRLFDCRLFLLVPSAAMSGLLDAFFTAELPKELSSCAWGGARATLGSAAAALAHAVVAALMAPAAARSVAVRLPSAVICALLVAAGGAIAVTDWVTQEPQRVLLPAALAGAGAAYDVVTVAAAAFAFPDRHTLAFSVLLGARAAGCLALLALSPLLCLEGKLLLMAGVLLVALTSTAALERLWGAGEPPPIPDAAEKDLRDREPLPTTSKGRRSFEDGMVEVPLGKGSLY